MDENSSLMTEREFDGHVRRLRRELLGFAMRQTRNAARAEDVVQESLLRAWRFRDTFSPQKDVEASVKSWLFKIVANTFVNDHNSRKLQARVLTDYQADPSAATHNAPYRPDVDGLSDEVTGAIEGLSPDFRDRVLLHTYKELSHNEIADRLGIRPGSVMSGLSRAFGTLRLTLADYASREYGIGSEREVLPVGPYVHPKTYGTTVEQQVASYVTTVTPPRPPSIRYALYQAALRVSMSPATGLVTSQMKQSYPDAVDNVMSNHQGRAQLAL